MGKKIKMKDNSDNWLVCGTRTKAEGYREFVFQKLNKIFSNNRALSPQGSNWKPNSIIEGCCPDSADVYAEEWAKEGGIEIQHHPATSGNYLARNIEMVKKADLIIAFWDGFSYGTAHTIAWATKRGVPVIIYMIKEVKE
jgi:hypothetical protein